MEVAPIAPHDLVELYDKYVRNGLDDGEGYPTEIILTLITRDSLDKQWADLTSEQRQRVAGLDAILVSKWELVAEILPNANSTDRRRRWWFLHEGPQVREDAIVAKRED